ncbi:hypothetical protein HZA97_09420 [Candidatus Woesearchaeota archaeon]|nr:hypothetical protein [Candidatus Woesearchaeota archaeon]
MERFKTIISIILLTVSIFLLFNKLFSTQPIQIILETGQEVTTQNSDYFSLQDALLLTITSFLIGATSVFLYYSEETRKFIGKMIQKNPDKEFILPLLKEHEKTIYLEISKNNGEMLQNKIVQKTGLSKVKVARIIARLERKKLIRKERYGLTNKILIPKTEA